MSGLLAEDGILEVVEGARGGGGAEEVERLVGPLLADLAPPVRAVAGLSTVFLKALVLGAAYERSGNVCVPMIAHGCYNLVAFSLLLVTAPA